MSPCASATRPSTRRSTSKAGVSKRLSHACGRCGSGPSPPGRLVTSRIARRGQDRAARTLGRRSVRSEALSHWHPCRAHGADPPATRTRLRRHRPHQERPRPRRLRRHHHEERSRRSMTHCPSSCALGDLGPRQGTVGPRGIHRRDNIAVYFAVQRAPGSGWHQREHQRTSAPIPPKAPTCARDEIEAVGDHQLAAHARLDGRPQQKPSTNIYLVLRRRVASLRFTERLDEMAGMAPSLALAETTNGLYKAECATDHDTGSNSPPWAGCTGSTSNGSTATATTPRPQNSKQRSGTLPTRPPQPGRKTKPMSLQQSQSGSWSV